MMIGCDVAVIDGNAMSLQNKLVVIVGGTSGIGFAVARAAMRENASVVVASSNQANVDAAVGRLSGSTRGLVVDVTSERSVESAFATLGPFDHLVFTAGDWGPARRVALAEIDLELARTVFAVRFWGALSVVKYARPHLAPDGSITLTDGMIAHRPSKDSAVSTAMAGAVEHLTRALAVELAPIRVNAVCPGLIRTEVWNRIAGDKREEQFQKLTQRQPLPRIGEPEEAAEAYVHLMRASYTTGQILHVDGGSSIV
jgi:NAD(P)-dependent dehydrogenase (short-subunit alcohol dehydrogenase family)